MTYFTYHSPKEIESIIKKTIIGQDDGVRTVATAFAAHLLRIEHNRNHPESPLRKDNMLIIGPTGSGKTESIMTAIRECDLPIPTAVVATDTLTASGFKGKSVETVLEDLFQDACRIVEKNPDKYAEDVSDVPDTDIRITEAAVQLAGKGIIILDEADKIRVDPRDGRSDSLFPRTLQHQLLKIVEGGTGFGDSPVASRIDTTDILFIFSGAFVGLDDIIRRRLCPAWEEETIGFHPVPIRPDNFQKPAKADPLRELTAKELVPATEDLIEYGFIPELLGRITVRCRYNPITADILYRILQESKLSPAKEFKAFFAEINNSLEFTNNALMEISRKADENHTGVRGLRNIIKDITDPVYYDLSDKTRQRVIITRKAVTGEASPYIAGETGRTSEEPRARNTQRRVQAGRSKASQHRKCPVVRSDDPC